MQNRNTRYGFRRQDGATAAHDLSRIGSTRPNNEMGISQFNWTVWASTFVSNYKNELYQRGGYWLNAFTMLQIQHYVIPYSGVNHKSWAICSLNSILTSNQDTINSERFAEPCQCPSPRFCKSELILVTMLSHIRKPTNGVHPQLLLLLLQLV